MNFLRLIDFPRQVEFMTIGGQINDSYESIKYLYLKLIAEELGELSEALDEKFFTTEEINEDSFSPTIDELDALADILVVSAGFFSKDENYPALILSDVSMIDTEIANKPRQVLLLDTLTSLQSMYFALKTDLLKPDFNYKDWQDAIAMLIVSVVMVLKVYNLDVDDVMTEVYDSNFSKFVPNEEGELVALRNDYGKIMKGPNFKLPDFSQFIKETENVKTN